MTSNLILEYLKDISSVDEFAQLVNKIKVEELGVSKYTITDKVLRHFSSSKITPERYHTFEICKKNGGTRTIDAPIYQLKLILEFINIILKALYQPQDAVMGFTSGKSIISNAQVHVGHHYVYNIDLKDFFPSITCGRVYSVLLKKYHFANPVASIIADLCTNENRVLPQGAPTSPILSNMVCSSLDKKMQGVAKRFGLHYTRYADDMSFSSMHNVYQTDSEFCREIKRVIVSEGFQMNDKKTRLLKDGQRQEVTGLIVNTTVNVTRKYVRDLRTILHHWEVEGYNKAYFLFYQKYKKEKGYIKKGEPVMENVIAGKLNYLRNVKGSKNTTYLKLYNRFKQLQQIVYVDDKTESDENFVFVQSYSIHEFEAGFSTSLTLEKSNKDKLIAKCVVAGKEKFIAISNSAKLVLASQPNLLPDFHVTLCRHKGKNFWLITHRELVRSRCLSIQNVSVDIDTLLLIWEKEGLNSASRAFKNLLQKGSVPQARNYKKKSTGNSITTFIPSVDDKVIDIDMTDSLSDLDDMENSIDSEQCIELFNDNQFDESFDSFPDSSIGDQDLEDVTLKSF